MKKIITKISKLQQKENDLKYRQTQSYQSRIDALEEIRTEYNRLMYNNQKGSQKVYRIIKRKKREL